MFQFSRTSDTTPPLLTKLDNYGQQGLKTPIRGYEVGEILKDYEQFTDLLPSSNQPAICDPAAVNGAKKPLSHHRLKKFITEEFDLRQFGVSYGQRVAILLPNGAELAVALLATISHWCAAPINATNTWEEIKSELQSTKATAVIILAGAVTNDAALKAADDLDLGVITITSLGLISGLFRLTQLRPVGDRAPIQIISPQRREGFITYNHPETVLVLHTSGTSGNKKLVPYSLDMIIIGVGCIVGSWNLSPSDVCLNMMPLFHIGGIVRNILSPILSGGCVITCSGFDPLLFWDLLYQAREQAQPIMIRDDSSKKNDILHEDRLPQVTWYYAAPTMHHAILSEAERRPAPLPVESIRYIANAAGGLLPVLATALRDTFKAVILTSYGMTECMPISTPPQNYALDPTGTSGTPVGPEILIVDDDLKVCAVGQKGNIFIRGPPCFGGYENNGSANDESFFEVQAHGKGWFNTGDMGSVDKNGYLFISGRSKEIINRGGETISPFEIEEAIQQHPHVKETIAFSAPHDQYQETVGAVIVTKPGFPRVDLPTLHRYLENKLHRSKWPQVIVYSNGLPKNAAGKALRIKFADRIGLVQGVDEESAPSSRIFEMQCPPQGTPLSATIPTSLVSVDLKMTRDFIAKLCETMSASIGVQDKDKDHDRLRVGEVEVVTIDLPSHQDALVCLVTILKEDKNGKLLSTVVDDKREKDIVTWIEEKSRNSLHAYLTPAFVYIIKKMPLFTGSAGVEVDRKKLSELAHLLYQQKNILAPRNAIEQEIEHIWRTLLGAPTTLSVTTSFFDLGGDSLKAGQVVGALRSKMRVPLSVADLLTAQTIEALAIKISTLKVLGSPSIVATANATGLRSLEVQRTTSARGGRGIVGGAAGIRNPKRRAAAEELQSKLVNEEDEKREKLHREYMTYEFAPPCSNTSFGCLFTQLLPIALIYPMRRIIIWFLIAGPWVYLMKQGLGRFHALLCAMFTARLILGIFAPLLGILCKWLIIGRYKAGRFPLWGGMYLRWWLVEQIVNIMGKGFFRDDLPIIGPHLVRWYYILMGANIGQNVKIHKDAKIGQADLLTIGNNVAIDNCIIRPFSIEEGHFVLLPIEIGDNCSVGVKSVVAAGAIVSDGTCIGPLSSSHEASTDANPKFRDYCRPLYASPPAWMIIFIGVPILLFVLAASFIPWFFVLKAMVQDASTHGWYQEHIHSIYHAFLWWITPQRLLYFFLLRIVKRCVVPYLKLFFILLVKWFIIGKFTELGERERNLPWNRFRYWLMAKLLPGGGLGGVAKLVGTHYEVVSIIYRLLGAKIGTRVYWPGSGLEIVEFDLLEIGNDVVFGSRSVVIPSSTKGSKKIVFEDGAMIADRCVILPGVTLRKGAVLGSGALACEDMDVPIGSVWLGSQHGKALNVAPSDQTFASKDTTSPFGKAFYEGKASFYVIPLWMIVLYNTIWQAFCTCYRNCPTALALIICSYIKHFDPFDSREPLELFKMTLVAFCPLYLFLCFNALCIDIVGKNILLGTRKAGEYPWDQSSYCQRWQVYLTLQEIRRGERHKTGILDMIQGSQYLVWYFRALGAKIGSNVCLFPNGGDPMFTEPDLVTVGDFVGIDDASVIAHINTRGVFRLNEMVIGDGCVLKSMSRLLSGASMEPHSILKEHTLVLAGEKVEVGSVWQGWPSRNQVNLSEHREDVLAVLDEVSMSYVRKLRTNKRSPRVVGGKAAMVDEEDNGLELVKPGSQQPSIGLLVPIPKKRSPTSRSLPASPSTGSGKMTITSLGKGSKVKSKDHVAEEEPLLSSFEAGKYGSM